MEETKSSKDEKVTKESSSASIVHEIPVEKSNMKQILIGVVAFLLIVALGAMSGYLTAKRGTQIGSGSGIPKVVTQGKVVGSTDVKTFRDNAEGVVQKNDAKNGGYQEGPHVLIRDNNPSHNAYLTSSVVDLDLYVGKKVRVWGETNKGLKAGWLMDVGRVEVLN